MAASFGSSSSAMTEMFFLFIGFSIVAVIVQFISEGRKHRNDRIIGRERNEAFRDVAAARNLTGDQVFDEKQSQLEMAEMQLALSKLNDQYQSLAQRRSELEEQHARVVAELAELKQKPVAPVSATDSIGSLGDADIIEEPSLDSSEIVFSEDEELES